MTYNPTPGGSDVNSAGGYTTLTVLDQPMVPCVVIRQNDFPMHSIDELFNAASQALPQVIANAGLDIVGPILAVYFRIAGIDSASAKSDVAIGFPVSNTFNTTVELTDQTAGGRALESVGYSLPSGRIAALTHHGTYNNMHGTWNSLITTLTERGLEPLTPVWEVYVSAPELSGAGGRTDLFAPLAVLKPSR